MSAYERSCGWVREKNQMVVVLITITMMLQLQMKGCLGCLETERMGLLELKSYLNSLLPPEEESILNSWSHDDGSSDCCLWEKVTCSDDIGGQVVDLSLDFLMPNDFLPRGLNLSLLHSFPGLQSFIFSGNYFDSLFDPIHGYKSLQKLEKLRTLDLVDNRLNYSALTFLNAARSLKTLYLRSNSLDGVFPLNGLINLRELEVLDLSYNFISGFEAGEGNKSFQRLEKLRALDLSYNTLDNSVLPFLSAASSLRTLSLRFCYLKGVINMNVLQDMPELQELDLSNNGLTDLDSLGVQLHSSLQVLAIAYNELTSSPKGYSEICRLMYLRELDLSGNALTSMPYCLGNLTRLRTLELSKNNLNGDLSSFVSGLPSALEYLSLLQNNFNGSFLFSSLINHTRLTVFKLSSKVGIIQTQAEDLWVPPFQLKRLKLQRFSLGRIPGFLVHQHELCFVDLSNNNLTGAFPTWLVKNNTRLQMLFLNNNSLTKLQLPRIVHGLEILNISSNRIVDSIQEDIGNVFPNLTYMNFASNHFCGAIPSSMGEMKSLQMLDMSSNGLSGRLPTTFLSGCYSLKFLMLSNNQFWGKVFPEQTNLTGLVLLFLGGNRFNGSLGKGLFNSKNLRLLDISDNSIFGVLPLWIGRMSSLGYLYMGGNQLKGPLPHQLQNLALEVLDISDNNFSGSIPRSLDISFLRELRLQSNEFEGVIPDNLFNAKQLEQLDLRNNNLSGMILNTVGKNSTLRFLLLRNNSLQSCIPEKICQLSGVGLLDLSYNKFRGSIPSCLGSMFSGGERSEGFWVNNTNSFVLDVPFRQTWIYTSSLVLVGEFSSGFERQPVSQPERLINFVMKSRYETYRGGILGDLYGLDLSSNQLSSEIPVGIGNLHNIKSLNLSSNQLIGSIPDNISKLEDLESLDLSNNKLDGNIPPQLGDLNNLGYFNVSRNNLSGVIPFKGHLGSFDEKSYIGNSHLCGLPTNISCDSTRGSEPEQGKEEEEEGDGVIDMVSFYWTCGAVYITTLSALFAFLCIDTSWSRKWFYLVNLMVHHLQRFKAHFFHK